MANSRFVLGYKCTLCGKMFTENETTLTCPECGEKGILDVGLSLHRGYRRIVSHPALIGIFSPREFQPIRVPHQWSNQSIGNGATDCASSRA